MHSWFGAGFKALLTQYRQRTFLGVVLMAAQAFCYNAVFFTYALILTRFYEVSAGSVGLFMLPFAAGNFLGPLLLGRLFDTLGRRLMITGDLRHLRHPDGNDRLAVCGRGVLDAVQQTAAWTVIFFFASAAASSAYLTVGESFPLEVRAIAIALFYAFGTGAGRRGRAGAVRRADRNRIARLDPVGVSARRRADAAGRCDRCGLCGAGRAPPVGGNRPAAVGGLIRAGRVYLPDHRTRRRSQADRSGGSQSNSSRREPRPGLEPPGEDKDAGPEAPCGQGSGALLPRRPWRDLRPPPAC